MRFKRVGMAFLFALAPQVTAGEVLIKPTPAQTESLLWASRVLERYRYKPEGQANPAGIRVLDAYLDALDPDRMIFTAADLAELEVYRPKLDTAGAPPDLDVAYAIFDWYRPRLAGLLASAKAQLRQRMDFSGNERYQRVRRQAPWASGKEELARLWSQRVMDDYLRLRIAGLAEKDIAPTLERRYDRYLARLHAMSSLAVFTNFMNAYTRSLDPDSAFYTDAGGDEFKTDKLAGTGVAIQSKGDLIHVHEVARNGAAAHAGLLKPGDRIVAIAPKPEQPMVEVLGWRVDEVVGLLRDTAGSTVTLDILPAGASLDAPRKRVSLVRDNKAVDTNVAESRIEVVSSGPANYRIGVLRLPSFYQDFVAKREGKKDFASVSRDVATHVQSLKNEKVDAVLLDLRDNGGGSLDETIRLTGLFAPGAVVQQQRSYDGKIEVESAPKAEVAWDGPLAVLVDKGTAAGAEIVAAALQDHGRAIVLGEPTYGRSTIQTVIQLERFAKGLPGDLKLTIAQVFRVDGSNFEERGVRPDILIPGAGDAGPVQRRGSAYRAAQVKPANHRKDTALAALLPALSTRYAQRSAGDSRHAALLQVRAREQAQRDKDEVSLNEAERRGLRDAQPSVDARAVQQQEALQVLGDAVGLFRTTKH